MQDHWKNNGPPVYIAVAGYLGLIKNDGKPDVSGSGQSDESKYGNLEELAMRFAGTGGMIN